MRKFALKEKRLQFATFHFGQFGEKKTTLRWIESHHIKQKTLYMHTHYKRKHQHNHSSSTHTFIHSFIHSVIWFGIASFISCSLPILSPIQSNFFSFFSPRQVIALCVFFLTIFLSFSLSLFIFCSHPWELSTQFCSRFYGWWCQMCAA